MKNKLTDYNHDKYNTTPESNKITAETFAAKLKLANLVAKTDDKLNISIKKLTQIKQNIYLLKLVQIFDSIYFRGKGEFEEDGTQHYLVFQPMCRYFKRDINSGYILEWKSKGLSNESMKSPSVPRHFLNPSLNYLGT